MSRFTESKKLQFINTTEVRMNQASNQLATFSQTVQDVYANWQGYIGLEDDPDALEESRVEFSAKARELVDERIEALAVALDIIAGGMRDVDGEPLTRQHLLDELASVGE